MLSVVATQSSTIQIWIESAGAIGILSGLFYAGRVLGRVDQTLKDMNRRLDDHEEQLSRLARRRTTA